MSSLYRKNNYYYLAVAYKGERKTVSLGTKDYKVARKLRPDIEYKLLRELITGRQRQELSLPELIKKYLKADHHWKKNTYNLNKGCLHGYLRRGLPENEAYKAMTIRCINACYNWGYKNYLTKEKNRLGGNTVSPARKRVFLDSELNLLLHFSAPDLYQLFIQLAYYTGARAGEIRQLRKEDIHDNYIETAGKTGKRTVVLSLQGKEVIKNLQRGGYISSPYIFAYSKDYVCKTFKKNCRQFGIDNARFHDLRRTFGLKLIKQGRSIYEVSKLLGHSSVRVTEKHYAPLLVTDVEDFSL